MILGITFFISAITFLKSAIADFIYGTTFLISAIAEIVLVIGEKANCIKNKNWYFLLKSPSSYSHNVF